MKKMMSVVDYYMSSRSFGVWRWIYTFIFLLLSVILIVDHNLENLYIGYYILIVGVFPSAIYLMLRYMGNKYASLLAYSYDIFLFLILVILVIASILGGFGLTLFIFPIAGSVCEAIFLTIAVFRSMEML